MDEKAGDASHLQAHREQLEAMLQRLAERQWLPTMVHDGHRVLRASTAERVIQIALHVPECQIVIAHEGQRPSRRILYSTANTWDVAVIDFSDVPAEADEGDFNGALEYALSWADERVATQWVERLEAAGIEAADLDELVHEAMQEAGLQDLDAIADEDEEGQEGHIRVREVLASRINNRGMNAQVLFLLRHGCHDSLQDLMDPAAAQAPGG